MVTLVCTMFLLRNIKVSFVLGVTAEHQKDPKIPNSELSFKEYWCVLQRRQGSESIQTGYIHIRQQVDRRYINGRPMRGYTESLTRRRSNF